MFDDDFSLDCIKDLIITLNIDPELAKNAIIGFLRDNYGKDKSIASLFNNQNSNISKRMNFYIDGNTWYIRVRKEKNKIFADNDFAIINLDVSDTGTNKVVFTIETRKSQLSRIKVCPMHEVRLNTKVMLQHLIQASNYFQRAILLDSIPSATDTNWIQDNAPSDTKQEFYFERAIDKMEFKIQFNCSNSCWRSMVPNDDEIILAIRCFKDSKLVNQVQILNISPI